MDAWCEETGHPKGYTMSFAQMWRLAPVWYAGRLDPAFCGRSAEDSQAVLESVGLTGDFWRLV